MSADGLPGAALPSPPGFPPDTFRANLYVHHADDSVEWYALLPASFARGPLVLGRDPECAINIDDGATSGQHASIEARGPALWLTDLGSTNGTLLEESRLRPGRPIRLDDGAVVGVGNAEIRFLYSRRDNPIRLVAEFIDGPLAGTRKVTAGPSTTIGRDAELPLDGPGVAPYHLRIDAYDAEHIYAVPLDREGRTRVFQSPLEGIAAIPGGAELTVGPHRFRLRVEAAPEHRGGAAPPRVDAAMHEARLQGHDPRAFDKRTIMDLSPLGAMVAKVLAGEVPPPPSAVRPPVRRPTNVNTIVDDRGLELARRTGPVPVLRPTTPGWVRYGVAVLVLVAVVAVAGLIPMPRQIELTTALKPGPPITVQAPVRGTLFARPVPEGHTARAGSPLTRLADEAIAAELDRLSHRIGALEVYAGDRRVTAGAVEAARRELDAAERALAERSAPGETFEGQAFVEARRLVHERRGRLEALLARRADPDVRPTGSTDISALVNRRTTLGGRLEIPIESPGTVHIVHTGHGSPGATVTAGQALYTVASIDPTYVTLDPAQADASGFDPAGQAATVVVDGRSVEVLLRAGEDGAWRAAVPGGWPPGTAATVRVEGRPVNALRWLIDRFLGG